MGAGTNRLVQIHAYFLKHLLHDLFPFLLGPNVHSVIYGVVHHLLPLLHDVVLLLELHGDLGQAGEVHLAVHASQRHGGTLHRLHHLLVRPICLRGAC